jgi:hypothetical protein
MDYPKLARRGLAVGVGLLLLGILGEVVGGALFGPLPSWEHTLFMDMSALGILIGLFSPILFGVVLPLTE